MEMKPVWKSWTLWSNLIMAAAAFYPPLSVHLTPEALATIFGIANTVLRFKTTSGVSLK